MAPTQEKIGFFGDFMLPGVPLVVAETATAPIERVKLLLKSQDEIIKQGRLNKPYKGVIDCTKRVLSQEGPGSFWRGNMANVLRYFPAQALTFAFKEQFKTIFTVPKKSPDFKERIKAIFAVPKEAYVDTQCKKVAANIAPGGCAGVLSLMFFYSLDFARTRLANDVIGNDGKRQFNGLIDVYKKILASDGISGLYRGFVISAVGIFVYRGLYFGLFDSVKPLLGENSSFASKFALGYSTTISASTVSYPIDTIRRRMMMTSGTGVNYKSPIDCRVQIVKNEGIGSLFKGAGANILRGISGALAISSFDTDKNDYIELRVPREN